MRAPDGDQDGPVSADSCHAAGSPNARTRSRYWPGSVVECPECGGDLVERRQKGKGGRRFYGCSTYPKCNFAVNQKPLPQPCPECSKLLLASGKSNARCTSCDYKGPVPEAEPAEVAV